jgi:hypothetical protein
VEATWNLLKGDCLPLWVGGHSRPFLGPSIRARGWRMEERATGSPAISVRRMHDGEERDVRALAGRVFSRPESAFFSAPPQTLVAERDGHLVGAVVPKVFALPDKRCYGAVSLHCERVPPWAFFPGGVEYLTGPELLWSRLFRLMPTD